MASAAGALFTAASLPMVSPHALAIMLAAGLLNQPRTADAQPDPEAIVDAHLRAQGSSLADMLQKLSPVGHVCALKGASAVLPRAALCCKLDGKPPYPLCAGDDADCRRAPHALAGLDACEADMSSSESLGRMPHAADGGPQNSTVKGDALGWCLLTGGILPAACEAVKDASDAHAKHHALGTVASVLQRIKDCLQVCSQSMLT